MSLYKPHITHFDISRPYNYRNHYLVYRLAINIMDIRSRKIKKLNQNCLIHIGRFKIFWILHHQHCTIFQFTYIHYFKHLLHHALSILLLLKNFVFFHTYIITTTSSLMHLILGYLKVILDALDVQYVNIVVTFLAWRAKTMLKTVIFINLVSHQIFFFYHKFGITYTTSWFNL